MASNPLAQHITGRFILNALSVGMFGSWWKAMSAPSSPPPATTKPFAFNHAPVLLAQVIEALPLAPDAVLVDGTVGLGGHAMALAKQLGPHGVFVALDRDPAALDQARTRLEADPTIVCQCHWINRPFAEVAEVLEDLSITAITGALLVDLGVSSYQLDDGSRGFSFNADGPLDMRMNPNDGRLPSAADLVATASEAQLAQWFFEYGEERYSRPIARAIVTDRTDTPFLTTKPLAELIARVARAQTKGKSSGGSNERIHPATRVFQALRIAVNDELVQLETLLATLPHVMAPGARAGLISFHSLEDRLVKQAGKAYAVACVCPAWFPVCQCNKKPVFKVLGNKPMVASEEETAHNPRSRSAKLRVWQRL
jgi:16S rRNA (cytosine1402-N4)-methyltransferase